uniref:cytochrome-c oxidase n=1 Tax=Enterogyrus malmbergi TaxID=2593014 RepID=A0A6M3R5A8_9PLAT|nr:cytochrome c oxidase subunit 2 [Enterogyrus malmbergi]QJD07086.1 cytochrome c oxidase subunit 2 [Enterogyrus malmbergi]
MGLSFVFWEMIEYVFALAWWISIFVFLYLVTVIFFVKGSIKLPADNNYIEGGWTLIPGCVVALGCYYNLHYLFWLDASLKMDVDSEVKVIGRQWYWTYEYDGNEYDSFMTSIIDNVDNPIRIPYGKGARMLVTSSDVIHSFFVPDMGFKVDAIPGRINVGVMTTPRIGVFHGYCSELCGTGHSYMPIVVEVVNSKEK